MCIRRGTTSNFKLISNFKRKFREFRLFHLSIIAVYLELDLRLLVLFQMVLWNGVESYASLTCNCSSCGMMELPHHVLRSELAEGSRNADRGLQSKSSKKQLVPIKL